MPNPIATESEAMLRAGGLKGFYLVSEGEGLALWSDGILYLRFTQDRAQWRLDFSLSRAEASFRTAEVLFKGLNARRGMNLQAPAGDRLAPTMETVKRHYNVIVDELEGSTT